jgi:hypothetical protein
MKGVNLIKRIVSTYVKIAMYYYRQIFKRKKRKRWGLTILFRLAPKFWIQTTFCLSLLKNEDYRHMTLCGLKYLTLTLNHFWIVSESDEGQTINPTMTTLLCTAEAETPERLADFWIIQS